MTQQRLTLPVFLMMCVLALIWGGSFLAIRTALDDIPPLTSVAHRVVWAALALWAVVLAKGMAIPKGWRVWGAFMVMGALNNVIPFSLMAWGQLHIETGLTAILNATTALWGILIAALVFADERLTWTRLTGVAVGLIGVSVAVGVENMLSFDPRSLAQLAVLAGTVSYGLAGSWARARLPGLPPLVAAAGMLTCSSFVMLPLAWLWDGPISLALQPATWLAILYIAVIATAAAYVLYYAILSGSGAGLLLVVTLMIPPVAIFLGAWARGETLRSSAMVGFCILALGLAISALPAPRQRKKSPTVD